MDTKGEMKSGVNWEIGIGIYTLLILSIKQITNENLLYSTETRLSALWWPQWEGNPKKRGYVCRYSWFTLLYSWNWYDIVKQLYFNAAAAAKSLQSRPTLCDPIDGSPPGSPVPEILQARTLEWVAISFSNAWKWKVKGKSLLATPWTAAHQATPSMGFSRQEYWSGVPLPSPYTSIKINNKKRKQFCTFSTLSTSRWSCNQHDLSPSSF